MEANVTYVGLPDECPVIDILPALQGSEKQIAWAEKIRDAAIDDVLAEFCRKYQGVAYVITSKQEMVNFLNNTKETFSAGGTAESITNDRLSAAIEAIKSACADYNKIAKMANNASARFWIETKKAASATPFRDYIFGKKNIYENR